MSPIVRLGNMLIISGQLPLGSDGKIAPAHVGKLGPGFADRSARARRRGFARSTSSPRPRPRSAISIRIAQVVRLGGFFNVAWRISTSLPQAMNGASDLMATLFGERGRHARTTVGVAHLPLNAMAEVEALFEVA